MKKNSGKSFKKTRLKYEEYFFRWVMFLSNYIIALILGFIIYTILKTGIPALSLEMITETPKGGFYFGKEGGVLNAIIGSLYLGLGSTFLAFVVGLPVALFMNTWLMNKKRTVNLVRFILDLLWGVPSIVYGAFGFTLMVLLGLKASLLAGIIVIALLILPIMIRGIDEGLKNIPKGLYEASYSLGSTKSETAFKVMMKQTMPCIITAVLLSFGRAIGDTAAVLFTTGFTDNIPTSLSQPTATLPLAIFFQLSSPIPEVKQRAYAAAVILTAIILVISILSRVFTYRYKKHSIKF
ncbi:MAG: phosphate ABC transporter permease PstA [Prolixibacteraceae bacterium]|nr:phosphate ABC transporter permease PstA [Prolixibacteraceae bacterium]